MKIQILKPKSVIINSSVPFTCYVINIEKVDKSLIDNPSTSHTVPMSLPVDKVTICRSTQNKCVHWSFIFF